MRCERLIACRSALRTCRSFEHGGTISFAGTRVAPEEADDVAELARLAPAAQRDVAEVGVGRPVRIQMLEACGRDAARSDAVDRDALRAELAGERLQPAGDGGPERVRKRKVPYR